MTASDKMIDFSGGKWILRPGFFLRVKLSLGRCSLASCKGSRQLAWVIIYED